MIKALTALFLISLLITACGGARNPESGNYSNNKKQTVTRSTSISWSPPSQYSDESPILLSEIGGYKIYAGPSESELRFVMNISDSSIHEFDLDLDTKVSHYIAVTCYDIYGVESGLSELAIVEVN